LIGSVIDTVRTALRKTREKIFLFKPLNIYDTFLLLINPVKGQETIDFFQTNPSAAELRRPTPATKDDF
jgi:hypothetical protein